MTAADCVVAADGLPVPPVKNDPWQIRARRAGLTQSELARLAGRNENAVSEGLQGKKKGGVPVYLRTIIRLWEVSDRKAREAILAEPEADADA